MKKSFLLMAAICATGMMANAQSTGEGSMMLGGNFNVNITKHVAWGVNPQFGYFIKDNIAVGIMAGANGGYIKTVKSLDGTKEAIVNNFGWNAGLFGRYYKALANNFFVYGAATFGYGSNGYKDMVPELLKPSEIKDNGRVDMSNLNVSIFPGFAFFPSPNWGIDFSLNNIISFNSNSVGGTNTNTFDIGAGTTPTIGINYYFGKE
ncbi:MAG: hypothetical protein KF882_01990 [Bacteroidia bacterium]|nr:hypothetical protein [Bacteroidia bacterium]MCO5254017.1 hypothetical protein [Bacteroidota bacterium]